jgi:hypothetical protein
MPALVAGIQVFLPNFSRQAWMAGTTIPGMTLEKWFNMTDLPCGRLVKIVIHFLNKIQV